MKLFSKILFIIGIISASSLLLADYHQVDVRVINRPMAILPPKQTFGSQIGASFGEGFSQGMAISMANNQAAQAKQQRQSIVTTTKNTAIVAWVGGSGLICRNCYEANLPLKQRVEMTALLALQLQETGYGVDDSVETAKTAIEANMGGCYVAVCNQ